MNIDKLVTVLEAASMEIQSLRKENAELKKASSEKSGEAKEDNIGYVPEEKDTEPIETSKKNSYSSVDEVANAADEAARSFIASLNK